MDSVTAPFGAFLAILAGFAADADSLRPVFSKIRLPPRRIRTRSEDGIFLDFGKRLFRKPLFSIGKLERAKGFEPSTPTLARLCSTPELRPLERLQPLALSAPGLG